MEEKSVYLADGSILMRSEEGVYYRKSDENGIAVLIDTEEGERLLFETANQLIETLEALLEREEDK